LPLLETRQLLQRARVQPARVREMRASTRTIAARVLFVILVMSAAVLGPGCVGEHLQPESQSNMLNEPFEAQGRVTPQVMKVTPKESTVAFSRYITVFFNEKMDHENVEAKFHLIDINNHEISGKFLWAIERATYNDYFEFYPAEQFESSQKYRIYLEKDATSYSGFKFEKPFEWEFTMNRRWDFENPLVAEP
jgi:hypothetical protein